MTAQLNPADAPAWQNWLSQFDATIAAFNQQLATFQALQSYVQNSHPELIGEYSAIAQRVANDQRTIATLQNIRNTVAQWLPAVMAGGEFMLATNPLTMPFAPLIPFANQISSSIGQGVSNFFHSIGLGGVYNGLGAIPVVIIALSLAAAVAALAVIAETVRQMYAENQRLQAMRDAEAHGQSPQQAAQTVNSVLGPPATGGIIGALIPSSVAGIPTQYILIGVGAVILLPPILRMIEKRVH